MFIKHFDILSKPLTLHYENLSSHSSIFSSILSLFSFIFCILYGIYLFKNVIYHINYSSFSYIQHEFDIGNFPINESSIFHFFTFKNFPKNESLENFIEIFGIMNYENTVINYKNSIGSRLNLSHYTYGKCKINSKKYKLNDIEELIKEYPLNNGYCINGYYNKTSNSYINIDDENFPYPINEKGISNLNSSYFQIIIQRCENDTFNNFNKCKSIEYIDKTLNKILILPILNIMSHEINVNIYNKPILNKLIQIIFGFTISSSNISLSNLIFQPLRIKSYNDLLFDGKYKEDYSFSFENNDVKTIDTQFPIYMIYQFMIQNKILIYERKYKKIQYFLSEIGGIINAIFTILKIINYLINKYQTFHDIEKIMMKRINHLFKNNKYYETNNKNINSSFDKIINLQLENNNILINKFSQSKNNLINISKNQQSLFSDKNNNHITFSFIKYNYNIRKEIGLFSGIYYQFFHSKNKKGKYVNIIYNYYLQIISEQNLFDIYFFCHNIDKLFELNKFKKC